MAAATYFTGTAYEDQPIALRNRVLSLDGSGGTVAGEDGNLVLQADVATLKYSAYPIGDTTQATPLASNVSLTVSACVFNTLQTWTTDSIGFNFQATIPASVFSDMGNRVVRVIFTFTLTSGNVFQVVWDLTCNDVTPNLNSA
jgi:hypothetical protein